LLFGMRDLPHPFWAACRKMEKKHINPGGLAGIDTVIARSLPKVSAHTIAGSPRRTCNLVAITGVDLRI